MSNDIRNWFKVDKTISKSIYSKTENEIITSPDTSHIIEDITIEEEIIPNKMRKLKVYTDGSALENGKKG